jgi:hypothetical protein
VLPENADGDAERPPGTCPIPAPAFRIETWPSLPQPLELGSWGRGKLWPEPSLTSLQRGNEREERLVETVERRREEKEKEIKRGKRRG